MNFDVDGTSIRPRLSRLSSETLIITHEEKTKRVSQFSILDILLLTASCAYGLALVPIAHAGTGDPTLSIAIMFGLTIVGFAISYPCWRYLSSRRFIVLVVNHLGYLLMVVVLGVCWDDEVFGILPILAQGPLVFLGHAGFIAQAYPIVSDSYATVFIIGCLFFPIILLMLAHPFRQSPIGAVLTSLGTALWYLAGIGGGLAGMP